MNNDVLILFNHLNNLTSKLKLKAQFIKGIFRFRHNRGHVTRGQFRQCLAIAALTYTQQELEAVEAAFVDDDGFAYRRFLEWIQPRRIDSLRYNILQQQLKSLNKQRILPEIKLLTSIQDILQKIKGQVKRFIYLLLSKYTQLTMKIMIFFLQRYFVVVYVCMNG